MRNFASVAPEDSKTSGPDGDDNVQRVRADIARAVRKICPRWLADEADDLTQIAVSRVIDRQREAPAGSTFTLGYLYRAAYSALIDEIRRRRRLREVPLDDGTNTHIHVQSAVADPERQAFGREVRDAVAACLGPISPPRRRALMLHLQGHSIAEIADLLDCGRKRAENLIYRGLADLRRCLSCRGVAP